MARKLFPYLMLMVAGGILLLLLTNRMESKYTTLGQIAEYTPSTAPTPVPEATPEPTVMPTPDPEPTLEEILNRLQGKLDHYGRVAGRLENEKYLSRLFVQRDPCLAQVYTEWETISGQSMQIGKGTLDLPFGLLKDPMVEVLGTGDRAVCRIRLRLTKNRRFTLGDEKRQTVDLYLASETACREAADELILARMHCAPP